MSARPAATWPRARQRIRELLAPSQQDHLAKALASYEALYAKQVAAAHYGEARQTLDSIVKLLGLGRPRSASSSTTSASYSDKQLAEEVARELPELIHEAERLTGGAAREEPRQSAQTGSWIPHSPTAKQQQFLDCRARGGLLRRGRRRRQDRRPADGAPCSSSMCPAIAPCSFAAPTPI